MKKAGFTLAEVLITLMILGVVAALTIPSLVQNTKHMEEIAQIKKGYSAINQAIAMNYALDKKWIGQDGLDSDKAIISMLKKRMNVIDSGDNYIRTQDGLTYVVVYNTAGSMGEPIFNADGSTGAGFTGYIYISTDPSIVPADAPPTVSYIDTDNNSVYYSGSYMFGFGASSVVPDPSYQTDKILFGKNT